MTPETVLPWHLLEIRSTRHQFTSLDSLKKAAWSPVHRKLTHTYSLIFSLFSKLSNFCPLLIIDRNTTRARSNGNAGANDFYSGLKLDGPLNKGMKTYVQVQKEQGLASE